jgi:hypothetical protein
VEFAQGIEMILNISFPEGKESIRDRINWYAKEFLKNKKSIIEGKVPTAPVRLAISHVCSRSGRWASVATKVDKLLDKRNPIDLLKKTERKTFLEKVYMQSDSKAYKDSNAKISQFLTALEGLNNNLGQCPKSERWERFEKEFENILETKANIGRKGRDNILRDCGFFNRIPIDVHEQRFLIRTGIFHKYASLNDADPTDYAHLANAMSRFSKNKLSELEVNGIRLSEAPGIVDLIIWYFSQEKTEEEISLGICAKVPKCGKCPLNTLCIFAKLRMQ